MPERGQQPSELGHADGEHRVGRARPHADASVDTCVDRAEVEVGRLVLALHAQAGRDGRRELLTGGGDAVAGVLLVQAACSAAS